MNSLPKDDEQTATIFVQIASYRDTECQHTVRDLFKQAANPDRIKVGICWQYDPEEDEDCFRIVTRPNQVSVYPAHWKESKGISWARNKVQQLWDGEDYILMIDSHMRFIPHWDVEVIKELKRCPAEKPMLSCSPAAYEPPDKLEANPMPTVRRSVFFDNSGGLRFKGMYLGKAPEEPLPAAFVAGGFMFCSSRFVEEIPYDPYMYFNNEEAMIAVRLFTNGWDIFSPTRQFTYHYYRTEEQTDRPLFFKDRDASHFATLGQRRFDHILGAKLSDDPEITRDLDIYGLGKERSLDDYAAFSGVNFRTKKLYEPLALRCGFVPNLERYLSRIIVPELDDPAKQHPKWTDQLVEKNDLLAGQKKNDVLEPCSQALSTIAPALERGAFMPFFRLPDQNGKERQLQLYGGRPCQVHFLPKDKARINRFFEVFQSYEEDIKATVLFQVFVLPYTVPVVAELRAELGLSQHLWADPAHQTAQYLGIERPEERFNTVVLSANLQVQALVAEDSSEALLEQSMQAQQDGMAKTTPKLIAGHAPILLVNDVLLPEHCERLIAYFHAHERHEGKVGGGKDARLQTSAKKRTDCFIKDKEVLEWLDERLIHSLFPEVEKVFGLYITRREAYKLGCYKAEEKGFFTMHRDNFDQSLHYRRPAISLLLNDDYEGGHLLFPEYGQDYYKPKSGAAAVFPCPLMHQVSPVTRGERYIMLSFYYAEPQARLREDLKREMGASTPPEDWSVMAERGQGPWEKISRHDNLPRDIWNLEYRKQS